MSKLDIQRLVKSIKQRRTGGSDVEVMYPAREWAIGLACTVFTLILGAYMSYQLYQKIQISTSAVPVVPTATVPYQAAVVEEALDLFAKRQAKYNEYKGAMPPIPVVEEEVTDALPEDTDVSLPVSPDAVEQLPIDTEVPNDDITPIFSPDTLPAPGNNSQ